MSSSSSRRAASSSAAGSRTWLTGCAVRSWSPISVRRPEMAESQRVSRRSEAISWSRFRELWEGQRRERAHPVRSVTTTVAVVCWIGAALLVFLTWNGAAERILVAEQMPYLVSGGLRRLLPPLHGCAVLLSRG